MGPNVKKLIVYRMARVAIPPGGGVADGVRFLSDPKRIVEETKKAAEWVTEALNIVRKASEPNPWKNAHDETIAEYVLKQIEEKKKKS